MVIIIVPIAHFLAPGVQDAEHFDAIVEGGGYLNGLGQHSAGLDAASLNVIDDFHKRLPSCDFSSVFGVYLDQLGDPLLATRLSHLPQYINELVYSQLIVVVYVFVEESLQVSDLALFEVEKNAFLQEKWIFFGPSPPTLAELNVRVVKSVRVLIEKPMPAVRQNCLYHDRVGWHRFYALSFGVHGLHFESVLVVVREIQNQYLRFRKDGVGITTLI